MSITVPFIDKYTGKLTTAKLNLAGFSLPWDGIIRVARVRGVNVLTAAVFNFQADGIYQIVGDMTLTDSTEMVEVLDLEIAVAKDVPIRWDCVGIAGTAQGPIYFELEIERTADDILHIVGSIDCSADPDYPAADAGDIYIVSVGGRIGGGAGPEVSAADRIECLVDDSPEGDHATVGDNWTVNAPGGGGGGSGGGVQVDTYTNPGGNPHTWTKHADCTAIKVILIGGGGGGAGGRRGSPGPGGSGGGGGARVEFELLPGAVGATEEVYVGAGGAGGAGVSGTSTDGGAGTAGGNTIFGNTNKLVVAGGGGGGFSQGGAAIKGGGGGGGTFGTATGAVGQNGANTSTLYGGGYLPDTSSSMVAGIFTGGSANATGPRVAQGGGAAGGTGNPPTDGPGGPGGVSVHGGCGGGGGGGAAVTPASTAGGAGGSHVFTPYTNAVSQGGGVAGGAAGSAGAGGNGSNGAAPNSSLLGGLGGSGGGGSHGTGTNGGNGGNGSIPGGGGGGGGGITNSGGTSGSGGSGADGIAVIIQYLG